MGLLDALDGGADTVVLVDDKDHVIEGPGFNVFCVCAGQLITPDQGMLEGITRRTVMEMAQSLGVPVQVRPVSATEFRAADEAFISSSGGGVLPVTRVDGKPVADGTMGPITRKLSDTYWAWHQDPSMQVTIAY
jgi:branched-chain amino acid aminotransferase